MLKKSCRQEPIQLGELKKNWSNLLLPLPGVYVISTGSKINRILGTDPAGVLYIGKSQNIQDRVWAFVYGNHVASAFLWEFRSIRERILNACSNRAADCVRALESCFVRTAVPIR